MRKSIIRKIALLVALVMSVSAALVGCGAKETSATEQMGAKNALAGDSSEEYYMITFLSGIEYWKGCYKGFEDAGKIYGIKTIYEGAAEYDVNKAVTVLEQVIANKPAGIAVSCINPDAYEEPLKKAIAAGIPVVTFDADSPNSGRYSFLATGNQAAGSMAAKRLAASVNGEGEVAVVTLPGQLNHEQRVAGFKETMAEEFPNVKIVQIVNGGGEQVKAAAAISGLIQANPNLKGLFCTDATSGVGGVAAVNETNKTGIKIVSFDTDKGTLDAIKEGKIDASIAQGTWNMGFWSLQYLFQLKHDLINPVADWKSKGVNPLPSYVDTGVSVVTKENVDAFMASK